MKPIFVSMLALTSGLAATAATAQDDEMANTCPNAFIAGDRNEDGRITAKEVSARTDSVFAKIDTNEDGALTREEFTACAGAPSQKVASESHRSKEGWADFAGASAEDGMSYDEFVGAASEAYSANFGESGKGTAEDWAEPFIATGAAGDGSMSEEEFAQQSARSFKAADENADDRLTRDEWLSAATRLQPDTRLMETRFDMIDGDNSGEVTPTELEQTAGKAAEDAKARESRTAEASGQEGASPFYFYYVY